MVTEAEPKDTEYITRSLICPCCGNKRGVRFSPRIHEHAWTFCFNCPKEIHFGVVEENGDYKIKEMNHGD